MSSEFNRGRADFKEIVAEKNFIRDQYAISALCTILRPEKLKGLEDDTILLTNEFSEWKSDLVGRNVVKGMSRLRNLHVNIITDLTFEDLADAAQARREFWMKKCEEAEIPLDQNSPEYKSYELMDYYRDVAINAHEEEEERGTQKDEPLVDIQRQMRQKRKRLEKEDEADTATAIDEYLRKTGPFFFGDTDGVDTAQGVDSYLAEVKREAIVRKASIPESPEEKQDKKEKTGFVRTFVMNYFMNKEKSAREQGLPLEQQAVAFRDFLDLYKNSEIVKQQRLNGFRSPRRIKLLQDINMSDVLDYTEKVIIGLGKRYRKELDVQLLVAATEWSRRQDVIVYAKEQEERGE